MAVDRICAAASGDLRVCARNTPVFDPADAGAALTRAPWTEGGKTRPSSGAAAHGRERSRPVRSEQLRLLDGREAYLSSDS